MDKLPEVKTVFPVGIFIEAYGINLVLDPVAEAWPGGGFVRSGRALISAE
jgi:hypothetical protein